MKHLLCSVIVLSLALPLRAQPERPRNIILMIADGLGPASTSMARMVAGKPLELDSILRGLVGTSPNHTDIADSAAAATALACGIDTYNGAIAVDTSGVACRTLLEVAEESLGATGLVATSRITHATPAAFAAHVPRRSMEREIADQMLAQGIEVIFGGGRREFPSVEHIATKEALLAVDRTPVVGLFAESHMAYEIDRDSSAEPSLAEMTRKAIELLNASVGGKERGFFLMVEGSRIDHAGHDNDPAGHLHDVLAYDEAVAVALEFARADGNTLVVSTADHETGGMSIGRDGIYEWNPDYLTRVRASFERMGERIRAGEPAEQVVRWGAAVDDLSADEVLALERAVADGGERLLMSALRDIVSSRALIGWTTTGHTAVDVGLYAYGPGSERFVGFMENDEVGRRLREMMNGDGRTP